MPGMPAASLPLLDALTLSPRDGGFVATHAPFRFSTRIDASGAKVADLGGAWSVGLHVTRMGRQGAMAPLTTTAPTQQGAHVAIDRGQGVSEWFSHDARGLEEGVGVATRPSGIRRAPRRSRDRGADARARSEWQGRLASRCAGTAAADLWAARGEGRRGTRDRCVDEGRRQHRRAHRRRRGGAVSDRDRSARVGRADRARRVGRRGGRELRRCRRDQRTAGDRRGQRPRRREELVRLCAAGSTWSLQEEIPSSSNGAGVAIRGTTLLVGTPEDDGVGAVYVFTRSGVVWTQQQKLVASVGVSDAWFGWSVAFDGTTAIVGAPGDPFATTTPPGAAYVFTRSGTAWAQQTALAPSDSAAKDGFGSSVAIDGAAAIVGANFAQEGFPY